MMRILKGNIVSAPACGTITTTPNGYLVVTDNVIEGVFETLPERFAGAPVEDWGDALILQSFADMHLHAPQYPMLGMGMDLQLLDWLNTYAFKTESRFADPDYARRMYRALAAKLIEGGTTRVCMFSSYHTDATLVLMEEMEKAGICGYIGKVNMDRNAVPYYQETTEESKRETLRWLDACDRFEHIKPILTPRFTPSCTNELMQWLGDLAKERSLPVQSHLSENLGEIAWVKELHPDCERYWETYHKYGLWKPGTVMAHCVYSDEVERKAMRDHGVTVVYCADSNINITSGVAPIKTMLNEGNRVMLGSDIAGGAQICMLDVIQMAIRTSKMKTIESDWKLPFLSVSEGFYLGTSAGAEYFAEQPGFAKGNRLHAVVIDDAVFPDTERLSLKERFERAVYLAHPKHIAAVYSDGRRVK